MPMRYSAAMPRADAIPLIFFRLRNFALADDVAA